MQISKRLEAVAAMVAPGCRAADIGTDHAYIPIELVKRGVAVSVIAMDVNSGPLKKAEENIRRFGLQDKIETRLSDGLAALEAGEADSIIIAGMGGPLTIRILREGRRCLDGCRELILQPQSEIRLVRAYLEEQGWQIDQEEMVLEDGKFYPMMHVVLPGTDADSGKPENVAVENAGGAGAPGSGRGGSHEKKMTPAQLRYGPVLLAHRHPVLHEFLLREQRVNGRILDSLAETGTAAAAIRRREVEQEQAIVEEALSSYR